ncbi:unnamed protein product [Lymnaea stagnalis]|uniref:Uncharacterized protein n=1 Tax=Lymnaea stagnalis TaxID=6523 RepID=A0AAV2IGD5_LYMST
MEDLFGGHFRDNPTRTNPPPRTTHTATDPHGGGSMYSGFIGQQLARQHMVQMRPSPENITAFCSPVHTWTVPDQGFHRTHHVGEEENYDQSMTDPYPSMIYLSQNMSEPTLYISGPTQGIPGPTQGIPVPAQEIPAPTHGGIQHAHYTQLSSIPHQLYVINQKAHIIPTLTQGIPAPTQIIRQHPHDLTHQRFSSPPSHYHQTDTLRFNRGEYSVTSYHRHDDPHQHFHHVQASQPTFPSSQQLQHPGDLSRQHLEDTTRPVRHEFGPIIRKDIHNSIRSSITKLGTITQVCGPPMVGKSTLVDQAVKELQESQPNSRIDGFLYHSFTCKRLATLQDILATVMATIQQGRTFSASPNTYTEAFVLSQIQSLLQCCEKHHHIFVFHKCESLRTSGRDHEFLAFLSKVSKFWWSAGFMVSVVFTTFKKFPLSGLNTGHVEVDMLTDPIDIKALLEHHDPGVDVTGYIKICQQFLCFPEAVVRFAEEYLVTDKTRSSPEDLEKRVCMDAHFHSLIFDKRVDDVEGWLQKDDLELLMYFGSSVDSTFTEENLIEVLKTQMDVYRFDQWVQGLLKRLKDNYLFRAVCDSRNRLAVHPLLVRYTKIAKTQGKLAIHDQSCNSFTVFVSHVLKNAEKNILLHGRKGQVYGCLAQEWPHVRHVLELAINCTSGTYEAFLKVAVHGRRLVMSCFPKESEDFYKALLIHAKKYGTPQQHAVLEACLGHVTAFCVGRDWKLSEKYMDSAIETLKKFGPVHYYKWALGTKANILQRQGNNQEAIKCFMKVKEVSSYDIPGDVDKILKISEQQEEEDKFTTEILETRPMIFLGDNDNARERLHVLLDELDSRCPNHFELFHLLNSIGLTLQRGKKDLRGALEWYQKAYIQRCYLEKICPQDMVVPLNNIGMCFGRLNQLERGKKYLEKALEIQLERSGAPFYTALTLDHIAELSIKQKQFMDAYEKSFEASDILKKIAKQHDFRLRVLNSLVHYRIIIRQLNLATAETTTARFVKSAEDFVEHMLELGSSMHLTDDGYHYMMTAYEHAMILNWGNSPENFQTYKDRYLLFVLKNDWLRNLMASKKDELAMAANHKSLYVYIRDTEYKDLDLEIFIRYMIPSCPHCEEVNHVYSANMWQDEVGYLINQRQQKQICRGRNFAA